MLAKCRRVHSLVYGTALKGGINWPWSGAMLHKVHAWEAKIPRTECSLAAHQVEDIGFPAVGRKMWTTFACGHFVLFLGWITTAWWRSRSACEMARR